MTPGNHSRPWLAAVGLVAVVAGLSLGQAAAGSRASESAQPSAVDAPLGESTYDPSVSADGRFVVFTGPPSGDDQRSSTIWLSDRADGSRTELTRPLISGRTGDSVHGVISADGCVVAVVTEIAYDLFRDDDLDQRWDVYRLLLPHCGGDGAWELVSVTSGAGLESAASDSASPDHAPAISGTGAVIAYVTPFSRATPELSSIAVVDLTIPMGQPGRSRPVAGTPAAAPNTTFRYLGLRQPSLSDDGQVIAFTSDAESDSIDRAWSTGVTEGGFATSQVYIWDRTNTDPASAVVRVSQATDAADGSASSPSMSADGRFVAFASTSTNLVAGAVLAPCAQGCPQQVYRFDRTDGSYVLVSRAVGAEGAAPVAADSGAWAPSITADGSEVLFITRATNLFMARPAAGGALGDGEIVVSDVSRGTLRRVSVAAGGIDPAPASNGHARVSGNGRAVVFDTLAPAAFGVGGGGRQVVVRTSTPSLSLSDLDVGSGGIGFPGAEWFVSVINDGPSTFTPDLLESSNADFAISGGTCALGLPVAPGGSCTVNIMLTPSRLGSFQGTLTVSESGFQGASVSSQLRGAGGGAVLAPSPAGADLAPLVVGELGDPFEFQVFNVGFGPTTVADFDVQGANPDDFVITETNCRGRLLAIGESCLVKVAFGPTDAGRRTASVIVANSDGEYTSMLVTGQGSYRASLVTTVETVVMGTRLGVGGAGFAPNDVVTIMWADGAGRRQSVTADERGQFIVLLAIGSAERTGHRTLVAQSARGVSASTAVTLVRTAQPVGPGSAAWPGG